jgi:hypothetical protein
MSNMLAAAINSRLSKDGFNIAEKIGDIASDFAARGFSQPTGPMYHAIDELCLSRMEQTTDTAIAVYKEQLARGGAAAELKEQLMSYLQLELGSLSATALDSYNRPSS